MPRAEFLSPLELDFLWEALGAGELPFPLTSVSHGYTMDERASLRRTAFTRLSARGMVSPSGRVEPETEDLLMLLARPDLSIDSAFLPDMAPATKAVVAFAARLRDRAIVATQDADGLTLRPIHPDSLVSEIVAQLPATRRGTEISVSIPTEEVSAKAAAGGYTRNRPSSDQSRRTLDRLSGEPNIRGGQIGVMVRDRMGARRRSHVLAWYDKASGRYLSYSRNGWLTIAPADAPALRGTLGEMVRVTQAD